jgi:hypothetical protein
VRRAGRVSLLLGRLEQHHLRWRRSRWPRGRASS